MARIFVIIWQLTTIQICPKFITILPQWVQNFAKTPNSPSKVCQRFLKVCPSGEISPNLDTLMATYLMLSESFEEPTCVWFRLPSLALLSSFIRLGTIVRFDLLPESFIQFAAKTFSVTGFRTRGRQLKLSPLRQSLRTIHFVSLGETIVCLGSNRGLFSCLSAH